MIQIFYGLNFNVKSYEMPHIFRVNWFMHRLKLHRKYYDPARRGNILYLFALFPFSCCILFERSKSYRKSVTRIVTNSRCSCTFIVIVVVVVPRINSSPFENVYFIRFYSIWHSVDAMNHQDCKCAHTHTHTPPWCCLCCLVLVWWVLISLWLLAIQCKRQYGHMAGYVEMEYICKLQSCAA